MLILARRFGAAALAVAVLGAAGSPASAQGVLPNSQSIVNPYFRVSPNLSLNQAAHNVRMMGRAYGQVPPWLYGYNPYPSPIVTPYYQPTPYPYLDPLYAGGGGMATLTSGLPGSYGAYGGAYGGAGNLYSNPSGGYGGSNPYYGGGYPYGDPYAGYLSGAAQVISAQGQFMVQQQQADTMREQRRQMALETHRKLLEEWQYERQLLANLPDTRDTERKFALHRALNDPPLTEILSAESLNSILANIRKLQDKGAAGAPIPLDEDLLKEINVTSGERGNIGLLKKGGRLIFPAALQGEDFEQERRRLEQLAPEAVKQVEFNTKVDPGTRQQLRADLGRLQERLNAMIREFTPSQGVEARRYLNQLDEALTALEQPDVQNFFNGRYVAKGKTVEDLVMHMKGLRFAPATQGDEAAYRFLQQRLAAYNAVLDHQTAQR